MVNEHNVHEVLLPAVREALRQPRTLSDGRVTTEGEFTKPHNDCSKRRPVCKTCGTWHGRYPFSKPETDWEISEHICVPCQMEISMGGSADKSRQHVLKFTYTIDWECEKCIEAEDEGFNLEDIRRIRENQTKYRERNRRDPNRVKNPPGNKRSSAQESSGQSGSSGGTTQATNLKERGGIGAGHRRPIKEKTKEDVSKTANGNQTVQKKGPVLSNDARRVELVHQKRAEKAKTDELKSIRKAKEAAAKKAQVEKLKQEKLDRQRQADMEKARHAVIKAAKTKEAALKHVGEKKAQTAAKKPARTTQSVQAAQTVQKKQAAQTSKPAQMQKKSMGPVPALRKDKVKK